VLPLLTSEVQEFDRATLAMVQRQSGVPTEGEVHDLVLLKSHYSRFTPAALKLINRRHLALSRKFTRWIEDRLRIRVEREKEQIDVTFAIGGKRYLVEFKIAYHGDTKRALREGLGQVFEYNHYPRRTSHDDCLLILDILLLTMTSPSSGVYERRSESL
jgi:hypothetical protein